MLLALQVYRHTKNVAMVWALEEIRNTEERKLLAGHIALYLSLFDLAQVCCINELTQNFISYLSFNLCISVSRSGT